MVHGHDGGRLLVQETDGKISLYDWSPQSDQFCSVTFFSGCKYQWEHISRGYMVAIDYDIVWRPASALPTTPILVNLNTLLPTIKRLKESLLDWNTFSHQQDQVHFHKLLSFGFTQILMHDLICRVFHR